MSMAVVRFITVFSFIKKGIRRTHGEVEQTRRPRSRGFNDDRYLHGQIQNEK